MDAVISIKQDGEALLGAAVLLAGALALGLVYGRDVHPSASSGGYTIIAKFNHAEGIGVGSDVRIAGVSVGKVADSTLAPDFRAVATLRLKNGVDIPTDTAAAIEADSLLGTKFIELKIGGDDAVIKPGGEIVYTQDSLTFDKLMDMILAQARSRRGYIGKELPKVL